MIPALLATWYSGTKICSEWLIHHQGILTQGVIETATPKTFRSQRLWAVRYTFNHGAESGGGMVSFGSLQNAKPSEPISIRYVPKFPFVNEPQAQNHDSAFFLTFFAAVPAFLLWFAIFSGKVPPILRPGGINAKTWLWSFFLAVNAAGLFFVIIKDGPWNAILIVTLIANALIAGAIGIAHFVATMVKKI